MSARHDWKMLAGGVLFVGGLSLFAQDKPADKPAAPSSDSEEVRRSREELQVCLDHVAPMQLQFAKTGEVLERVAHPVMRFGAPLFGNHHGTLWIWGKRGRPVAVLEFCQQGQDGCWHHGCHSTTDTPLKLTMPTGEVWLPKSSNLTFQPLPGAPVPADSPAARMRQMKAFLQKFSAHQFWTWPHADGSRHELRMLPTPVHRYEDRDQQLIDGALFLIAQGTNPEATLFLEAIKPAEGAKPIWQFAVGQSSLAENVVLYDDQEIHHGRPVNPEEALAASSTYWRVLTKIEKPKDQAGQR